MRYFLVVGCALAAMLGSTLFPSGAAASAAQRCFAETGKCVEGRFLDYWNGHGGLAINGLPLTEEREERLEDGRTYTVQWFERVRLEYHPENPPPHDVLLGQFGRAIRAAEPGVAPQPGQRHFAETGHNVPPDFLAYWAGNGGLPQFGFPLSEVFRERLENGNEYEVQYFERARFERHPGQSGILLGQFGRRILNAPWGSVLAPLGSDYFVYNDPQGRFTARVPADWTAQEDGPQRHFFRKPDPGTLWGVEIALYGGWQGGSLEDADRTIGGQIAATRDYVLLTYDKVNIGPHKAYRRIFQHTSNEGQTEILVRLYFISGEWLYQINGFMLPDQRSRVEPLVNGFAGSIVTNR